MQMDSTLGTKSRQNGVQSAIIEASCYHKHVIQAHPAIFQTVSLQHFAVKLTQVGLLSQMQPLRVPYLPAGVFYNKHP